MRGLHPVTASPSGEVDPRLGVWLARLRRSMRPEQVGITPGARRRAGWLTQVEVARLAGVTARAYQAVEQGHRRPGQHVLAGVVAALQMTPAQAAYARLLADPGRGYPRALLAADRVRLLVDGYGPPAVAFDHNWQVVAANEAWTTAVPDVDNLLLWALSPAARRTIAGWSGEVAELVARWRMIQAHYRDTSPFAATLGLLLDDPYARRLWEAGVDVATEPAVKAVRLHTASGISVRSVVQLQPAGGDLSLRLAVCLPG